MLAAHDIPMEFLVDLVQSGLVVARMERVDEEDGFFEVVRLWISAAGELVAGRTLVAIGTPLDCGLRPTSEKPSLCGLNTDVGGPGPSRGLSPWLIRNQLIAGKYAQQEQPARNARPLRNVIRAWYRNVMAEPRCCSTNLKRLLRGGWL
jgi:hypothetical protein